MRGPSDHGRVVKDTGGGWSPTTKSVCRVGDVSRNRNRLLTRGTFRKRPEGNPHIQIRTSTPFVAIIKRFTYFVPGWMVCVGLMHKYVLFCTYVRLYSVCLTLLCAVL